MIRIQTKKSKTSQYVIGGTVAVVILGVWISLPLMTGSSMDSSVSSGNPFKSKVVDITSLGSDIPSEGGAPGSPLSGEMINNPATSGESIASSLFQSGPDEDPAAATADASASAPGSGSGPGGVPSASGGAPSAGPNIGKLAAASSITGGNSNTMTTGSMHNKFFGSGNQKSDFTPVAAPDLKGLVATEKKSSLIAILGSSADKSQAGLKNADLGGAKNAAAAAFGGTTKAGSADLNGKNENASAVAGLQLGETAQDLKKNDPALNKTKVTPPSEPKDSSNESEEFKKQIMQMIIQMVLKMALGAVFGAAA